MGSTTAASIRLAIAGEDISAWLRSVRDPAERTHQVAKLSPQELRALGALLTPRPGADLLESIDDELAGRLLAAQPAATAAGLVVELDRDHAADVLREVDASAREELLSALPAASADPLRGLLSWPHDSVAAHMVPEALTVQPDMTVGDAVDALRRDAATSRSDSRTGAYVYVTDEGNRLRGVVAFRDLVLAEVGEPVSALTNSDVLSVSPLTDAEDAAQMLMDHNLVAMPVVDADNRLLGILTENTAGDITEEEVTEDAERQGGSEPLEVPYLRASPWLLWRKRIGWLLLLFVAEATPAPCCATSRRRWRPSSRWPSSSRC